MALSLLYYIRLIHDLDAHNSNQVSTSCRAFAPTANIAKQNNTKSTTDAAQHEDIPGIVDLAKVFDGCFSLYVNSVIFPLLENSAPKANIFKQSNTGLPGKTDVVNDEDHPAEVSTKLSPTESYQHSFPNGHDRVRVDGEGLLSGYHAVIAFIKAQHPLIQAPTVEELHQVRVRPDVVAETKKCDFETEEINFYLELLAYLLEEWGRTDDRDLDLQLAFYVEPAGPHMLYPEYDAPEKAAWNQNTYLMVWFHSDGASLVNPEDPSLYLGMQKIETMDSDVAKKSTMENWRGN